MTAPVEQVKQAAAEVIAANRQMNATLYTITRRTFENVYGRDYTPATDRKEFERIKWHVKRALSDTGPGRGGAREGAGRPKGEQAG